MKRLIIVGAGEFGREILGWLDDINNSEWHEICFIDDNLMNVINMMDVLKLEGILLKSKGLSKYFNSKLYCHKINNYLNSFIV